MDVDASEVVRNSDRPVNDAIIRMATSYGSAPDFGSWDSAAGLYGGCDPGGRRGWLEKTCPGCCHQTARRWQSCFNFDTEGSRVDRDSFATWSPIRMATPTTWPITSAS
jgi:hypothetical protein